MTKLVEKHRDDLITMLTMVYKQRFAEDYSSKGRGSVSMNIIIVTFL